ncbi:MAG TPA: hypothetical protein VJS69_03795 [Candidatus Krumholzibacteria bacterium]|nr:hypothetical protein [Candidatus Krumholzibacteria bacterium]
MTTLRALFFSVALILLSSNQSARADTSIGDDVSTGLWLGTAIVGGGLALANTLAWTGDGNNALGVTGVLFGFAQTALGLGMEGGDDGGLAATLVAVGALDIVTGFGSMIRASHRDERGGEHNAVHIAPSVQRDGSFGVQLSSSW